MVEALVLTHSGLRQGSPGNSTVGCIHRLFEAQAHRTPDTIAVTDGQRHLTYRDLNEQANRLARQLIRQGAKPEDLVGICLERSAEIVVAILAVLKAGAAYLPLDPVYPPDWLTFMLEDSEARLLITTLELRPKVGSDDVKRLFVNLPSPVPAGESVGNPSVDVAPANLAYVIYTSGSTGRPKGVLITHHNVARLMQATAPWFHFDARDVWTLFHSFAFDFSVWEIWGALLHGGRLVVVPYLCSRSPQAFCELLAAEKVTVLNQTPTAFVQLIQPAAAHAPGELALRYIIFGGEALEMKSLKPWFERYGDARPQLVNMYGITETTVHVTYRPLTKNDIQAPSVIGAPIPDLQVYILDSQLQPVPLGVEGELYVGGAGLARGYLKRPELTAERFISHPFSDEPRARLYKTGDLARRLPDGDIEYRGRLDSQVKIRGHRVELGEIEAALVDYPGVIQSVVIARPDDTGDKRLVAYLVADKKAPVLATELRCWLMTRLPGYMVPVVFVLLDEFPLNANGKLDRSALPNADSGVRAAAPYLEPRNERERQMVALWERMFGLKRVGIDDNFFDLGGHSVLATELVTWIEQNYQKRCPILVVYEEPTVARLVDHLERGAPTKRSGVVPICVEANGPNFFMLHSCSFPLAYLLRSEFRSYTVYSPMEEALGNFTQSGVVEISTEELASRYVKLLLDFQKEGPFYLLGFSFGSQVAFEIALQLSNAGREIGLLCLADGVYYGGLRRRHFPWIYRLRYHLRYMIQHEYHSQLKSIKRRLRRAMNKLSRAQTSADAANQLWWKKVHLQAIMEKRYRAKTFAGDALFLRTNFQQDWGYWPQSDNGWAGIVGGKLEIVKVNCFHMQLLDNPFAQIVADAIRHNTRLKQTANPGSLTQPARERLEGVMPENRAG